MRNGTKMITALLALMLMGGLQTDVQAQARPNAPTTAEQSCASIRNAHIRELRWAGRVAGDLAHLDCARTLRVCRDGAVGTHGVDGCGARGVATRDCELAFRGCWETYRQCDTFTRIRAAKKARVAAVFHEGCSSLTAHGCPLKKVGRRNEPKYCPKAATIVRENADDGVWSLFD